LEVNFMKMSARLTALGWMRFDMNKA